jgi:hypothetical protein
MYENFVGKFSPIFLGKIIKIHYPIRELITIIKFIGITKLITFENKLN